LGNPNQLAQSGLTALVPDPSAQPNAVTNNTNPLPDVQPAPQPLPQTQPPFNASQFGTLPGFNPQNPNPPQPTAGTGQPNPLPGSPSSNTSSNPALNAIDNALFRPNQVPTTGPTGSPGIAGVASTFKGPSIKAYKERTKYQEWEFVYEPAVNQPGANQPGANPLGQPGAPAQNPLGGNTAAPAPGQTPAQGSNNPFSQTNIFGPQAPTTQ
jgi:hypothetical protein